MLKKMMVVFLAAFSAFVSGCCKSCCKPYGLTTEWRVNPCGIDVPSPRLAWKGSSVKGAKNVETVAWRIIASSSKSSLAANKGDIWDSGKVDGLNSLPVSYAGKMLSSSQRVFWKVKTWNNKGEESEWSEVAEFTMGVMKSSDWSAKWIGPNPETRPDADMSGAKWITAPRDSKGVVKLQKTFHFNGVKDGEFVEMIHASHPMHVIYINGKVCHKHSGHIHNWRYLHFRDITMWLKKGENKIEVEVVKDNFNPPNAKPYAFVARFNFPDGSKLVSDSSWVSSSGAVQVLGDVKSTDFGKELVMRVENASPAFEKVFKVKKPVASAVLHITGVGFYEASLNGEKLGKNVLDPAPTAYDHRVLYSTHRLDDQLKVGENKLNILVGHGWYDVRSFATWNFNVAPWRDFPRAIAQLEIVYADGEREIVATDKSWRQVKSPIGFDCIREGEVIGAYDPSMPDLDSRIINAVEVSSPKGRLMSQNCYASQVMRTLKPKSIESLGNGTYMIVFPENIAGWMRLSLRGQQKGDVVSVRYDERINKDGTPAVFSVRDGLHNTGKVPDGKELRKIDEHFRYTASHRVCAQNAAMQTDRYVCSGNDGEIYEPRFTYNGFQYVLVKGLRKAPVAEDVTACIVRTAFPIIGSFSCSDETFNTLMKMGERAYISNFANGYPTDCPHREKNGWTGDASIASELAQYCFENTSGYEKWLSDVCDTQRADGNLCCIAPTSGWGFRWGNGPAWDSALPVITWNLWNYRNNRKILDDMYEPLKRYLEYTATKADASGLVKHGLGDWVPVNRSHMPSTELTSSCYYYQALRIASEIAKVKGLMADSKMYDSLAQRTRDGINKKYYKGNGIYDNGGQTAQAFPLAHGIVESSEYNAVAAKLVESVLKTDCHVDMGLLGTKYVFRTLSMIGRTDLAFKMLVNPTYPSMVEWIKKGGTTLYEDWTDQSSRNHIMFGDFMAWAYQYLAGIRLAETKDSTSAVQLVSSRAFKHFTVEPQIIDALTYVDAAFDSPYGKIVSSWRREGKKVILNVTVPPDTTATIKLLGMDPQKIGSGEYTFAATLP
jgi:alpha-L-rhamnosidase